MTPQYKRVLLKLSGEMLGKDGKVLSDESLRNTAERIKLLHDMGVEIGIVVGGGNIMRGRNAESMDRNRADHMGMLSTAINSLALQDAIERAGMPCTVLSAVEMQRFCDTYSARKANSELSKSNVVVFACGTGIPFFFNRYSRGAEGAGDWRGCAPAGKERRCSIFGGPKAS